MPKCSCLFAGLCTAAVAWNVCAAGNRCYVTTLAGEKVHGTRLEANANGDLLLELDESGRAKKPFKRGTYKIAYIPKTKSIRSLEQAHEAGEADYVLKNAPAAFEKYRFVGWGDYISYLEGMVRIDRGEYAEAKAVFERGKTCPGPHELDLARGMVLACIGLGEQDEARPLLNKLVRADDSRSAAFAFNARARLLAAEGKKREALLEYMKTLLLFKPNVAERERAEARKQVIALLKENKDPRWQDIEKIR